MEGGYRYDGMYRITGVCLNISDLCTFPLAPVFIIWDVWDKALTVTPEPRLLWIRGRAATQSAVFGFRCAFDPLSCVSIWRMCNANVARCSLLSISEQREAGQPPLGPLPGRSVASCAHGSSETRSLWKVYFRKYHILSRGLLLSVFLPFSTLP